MSHTEDFLDNFRAGVSITEHLAGLKGGAR
jgi:hypothetical protein